MWTSMQARVTPTAFGSATPTGGSTQVAPHLMEKLNRTLDKGVYTKDAHKYGESTVIITRKNINDALHPVQVEVLFLNGSREIFLTPDGKVLRAFCAGVTSPRVLPKAQAKSMVENFLMQEFSA